MWNKHTFVVCAYKESPYLEECIRSLLHQQEKSSVCIATSTPNEHIEKLAKKYHLEMYVNHGESGIAGDWNYALSCTDTPYVTIAHQDDVYHSSYLKMIREEAERQERPLVFFTDYCELRNGQYEKNNRLLKIKRALLFPLRSRELQKSIFVRRRVLSLGNPICCPAVTFAMERLEQPIFRSGFRSNVDWEAWEKISRSKGNFAYIPKVGMAHRIHEGSETSAVIGENLRQDEDRAIFEKFWPKWLAGMITKGYGNSEKSNSTHHTGI